MELFNYLIDASICMALCYLPYVLILKKLTFFSANRAYLLFIVAASLIIPVLHIKVTQPFPIQHSDQHVVSIPNGTIEMERQLPAAAPKFQLNWTLMAAFAYGMVSLIMLGKLFYGIFKIVKQARLNGITTGNYYIVHNHSANNSSFFNIIFLNSENADGLEIEQVLGHEQAHARLFHSADNLFIETVKAFFWFNPYVYFIASSLRQVHEYEVDQALKNIFDPKKYASLLLRFSAQPAISFTNQFSAYSLKTRISMMFKPRSSAYKKWCYLISLPILLITFYAFSIEKIYGGTSVKKGFVLVLDAGHGGNDLGARGIGGHYEKDITLQLVKQINLVAGQRGIRTILIRSDDRSVDFHNRGDNKADAFISIHINDTYAHDKQANGMMVMVSKNSLDPFSKKLAVDVKTSLQQLIGKNSSHEIKLIETSQNLVVLKHNKAPAILIEAGYINNQNDMNYLLDPHGQHEIAEKIIDAVLAYGNGK